MKTHAVYLPGHDTQPVCCLDNVTHELPVIGLVISQSKKKKKCAYKSRLTVPVRQVLLNLYAWYITCFEWRVIQTLWEILCSPILMHSVRYRPFLVVSGMSSRWLNVLVFVLSSLSRPWYPLVRAGRIHDMLLLKVGMRATRGHILQEVVMHVIGMILEKHFQKKDY